MGDRRQPGGGKAPRRHSVRPRVARPDSWNAKCLISTSPPKLSPPASLSLALPPPPSPSPAGLVLLPPPPARSCSPGADQVTTPNRTTHLTPPGPFLAPFPLPHFWINNLPSLPISFSLSLFVPPPERSVGSAHRSIGVRRPASQSEFSGGSHPVHHSLATSGQDRLCGPAAADRPKADAFETRQLQCTQRTRPTEL